ncbi:uncharacterized protein LOC123321726 [Coccinella septempunctata]|uniref:uncharacterized protein LOC123321726 n=1 Tax=Coccinella septempunctata TaxID=41139 RepID=UPI001D070251|nr:uncharacterized protein LOC123321726 [Coccinella septempunctata]
MKGEYHHKSVVNLSSAGVLNSDRTSYAVLATALVEVSGSNGTFHKLRCLIDSASMTSFITKHAASRLGLRPENVFFEVTGLNSSKSCTSKGLVAITIRPVGQETPILHTNAFVITQITEKLPNSTIPAVITNEFKNLKLADPSFNRPGNIDILFGVDMFAKILLGTHISGSNGIDAFDTIFGFILIGGATDLSRNVTSSFFCNIDCQAIDDSLPNILKGFWEIESVPSVSVSSSADDLCEKIFVDTHKRDVSGKYIVFTFCK